MKRLALFAMLAASSVVACAGLFGFEHLDATEDSGAPEASTPIDASIDADATTDAGRPGCDELGVPKPPTSASQNQLPSFYVAMDLFDLGIAFDGGAPQIVGYNLDLTCTDSDASTSCAPGPGGMVQKDAPTPPGMDNVGSMLIALPGESSPFSPANIYSALRMGKFGALISVSFYNGELDDDSVKVNFFPAIGLKNGALPNFDSADLWQTDDNYDIGGGTSKLQSNGYVAGGRLVVKFDEVAFDVPVGDDNSLLHLHLVDAVLSAKLEKDDAGPAYRLTDGVIGGRWKLAEMLGAIGTIGNGNGGAVCTDGVYGPIVKAAICQSADLAPAAAADRTGATCGAVSVGCRFTAYYVADRDAQKHRAPTTPRTCPPDYTQCQ